MDTRMYRQFFRFLSKSQTPLALLDPQEHFHALVQRADTLRDAGKIADAASAYQQALMLDPARHDLRVQLGNMLKDAGQRTAAERAYREALAQSDQADTHLQLGHVLKAMGNRAAALSEYRQALALDPALHSARQELAEAGDPGQQERRFAAQVQGGGIEALLSLSHAIAAMRSDLDRLSRMLPEALAQTAFPIGLYGAFRDMFPVPAPWEAPGLVPHLVLLAEREDIATLFAQIGAIQAQSMREWTLSVLGYSLDRQAVAELAAVSDRRIRWVSMGEQETFAFMEHRHVQAAQADWIVLLAPGALLDPQALAWVAAAAAWSGAEAFIADEETVTHAHGGPVRSDPVLRQVVDFDTLLESNVFGETVFVRRDAYCRALPHSGASVAAARTALLLGLSADGRVGHVPFPLVGRSPQAPAGAAEHKDGVAAFLAKAGLASRIEHLPGTAPSWRPRQPSAAIAVIVPTRDNAADVSVLVSSLRGTAAAPGGFEVIVVDNGTIRAADLCLLKELAAMAEVRVLRRDGPFNWSHLNNQAAAQTDAPLLVFVNDDMRMVTSGWDARLRGLLDREQIGAVGARLLYNNDTVQHAGVLFGWKGSVIHDGLFEPATASGPAGRWQVTREVCAVTGAFLATRRDRFLALGGFDAEALPVAYSDIDYALKLRAAGLKLLWTPAITLYHHESKTRSLDHLDSWGAARNAHERDVMAAWWGTTLDQDPGVHPFWHAATLPFRLLAAPSLDRVRQHIIQTGATIPWSVPGPRQSA